MTDPWVPKTQKGVFGNVVLWILAILVVAGAVSAITFGVRWLTAPAKGKLAAREQINSGSFRIAAYDHFFNLCAAVQTDDARLDAQADELASSTSEDDRSRIRANIAGISSDRAEAINEYDADASKSYTIGQFRASKLPYRLDASPHRKGESVSCAA